MRGNTLLKISKNIKKSFNFYSLNRTFQFNSIKVNSFCTKNDNSNDVFSGIHSDFQPKVKKELNSENVMEIVDDYVKNNEVCAFIKGTKEMPRCGFSNYLIQVLKFYKINEFKDVNVLESEVLREAIKDYSNWPTFPQLYIKGELIGGCDIIKEMHENGTFEDVLKSHNLL